MKKYLFETIFYFLLPLTFIAVVAEYSIRKIPNDYAYKSKWMQEHSNEIQTLCLGPSSVFYDINPVYFSEKGFNAAHVSQSIKYDHFIFNKFLPQMDALQNVIIGIDYWSPYGTMEESAEWWRVKYYHIHYACDYHKKEKKYNYELYFHNAGVFGIAFKGLLNLLKLREETHLTVNEYGYGENYTLSNRTADWDEGKPEALRHNQLISESVSLNKITENKAYIEDICKKSAEHGIRVFLINTPLRPSYYNNLTPEFLAEGKEFSSSFAREFKNVSYLDFSTDDRFSEEDFYDSIHLNETGSKKFTLLMDSIMLNNNNTHQLITKTEFNK